MYNQFIATRKKGRRPATESNTAGAAKTVSISARSKSELKEWGERMNLTPGPRTQSEIRGMSSQQVLWEEAWNGEEYNKALALPDKIKAHKDIDSQWKAKKFWDADSTEGATPDEYKALTADFKKFIDTYPQYKTPHADENNQRLFDWLRDRHMAPIFSNLVLAFEATAMEGRLWLSPSAIAAGKESEVFGTDHHAFHLLVQPQRRNADA